MEDVLEDVMEDGMEDGMEGDMEDDMMQGESSSSAIFLVENKIKKYSFTMRWELHFTLM